MGLDRTLSIRAALERQRQSALDVVVGGGVIVLLFVLVRAGKGTVVPFSYAHTVNISTNWRNLPYYAVRSVLRMFIALAISTSFALWYGYTAARSRRLEKVFIPLLDILQSVPPLGFLAIIAGAFIALAPHSELGLELTSIFVIFTSQAWNMTFSFYHALITQPRDLDELSKNMSLTRWMRFWKIDVPSGAIGLVWNGMMSMAGAWFFLSASEAVSASGKTYQLPGVGAYAAQAIGKGDMREVLLAILAMVLMVVGVNFLFWRPLVAWSERFKIETSESADTQRSILLDMLQHSRWPRLLGNARRRLADPLGRAMGHFGVDDPGPPPTASRRRMGDVIFAVVVGGAILVGLYELIDYTAIKHGIGLYTSALGNGFATFLRVMVLMAVASVVWVPIGVRIGESPKLARIAQPLVQVFASFPANFLFPFATVLFLDTHISLQFGAILLMALGSQWYILFNTIAGAMSIPTDLREAMDNFNVHGWERWRRLIIPAIFPYYVTGAITASGGAWNASILAELVKYGNHNLVATGLGAAIDKAAALGSAGRPAVLADIIVMSVFVVTVNRLLWRPLYGLAERKYKLG